MSAPAGLWTIWDLNVEGSAGCAVAICPETTASEIASKILPVIFEPSPINRVLLCCYSLCITTWPAEDGLVA